MGYQAGIDLGTTYTAAATSRDGRAQVFPLGTNAAAIPSVVLLRDDGTVLTGEAAARRATAEPERVVREFKRRIGDPTPILVGGSPFSAEAVSARLLAAVVEQIAAREGEPFDRLVLSHPANWGDYKLDVLRQMTVMAGLDPERVGLITEPEAAAISYAQRERVDVGEIYAVYDLGGGTFDAAVVRRTVDGFELLGRPEGIERLGGIDFDAAVMGHVRANVGDHLAALDPDDPAVTVAMANLRGACVAAKEALSADTDAVIPVLLPSVSRQVRITRREFEDRIRPPLHDTVEALRRAVASAGLEPSEIVRVLLVGGSSRIPLVAQLVSAGLGRPVAVDAHPKHAVALGAAWSAATTVAPAAGFDPNRTTSIAPPDRPPVHPWAAAAGATGPEPTVEVSPDEPAGAHQTADPTPAGPAPADRAPAGSSPNVRPPAGEMAVAETVDVSSIDWAATVPMESAGDPAGTAASDDGASPVPPRGRRSRRVLVAAAVIVALLAAGGGALAVARGGMPVGRADSSTVAAGDEETDDAESGEADDEEGEAGDEPGEDTDGGDADGTGEPTGDDGDGNSTTTTENGDGTSTTRTADDDTTGTTTDGTTTTEAVEPDPSPIRIIGGPTVDEVTETSFRFSYRTNPVCGDGGFVVRRADDNALVGSFTGDGSCYGPTHGGFPQASDPTFGGFDLQPGTTYTVSVSVRGIDATDTGVGLGPGSGTDSTSFDVTTAGDPPGGTPVPVEIVSGPTVNVTNATSFQFSYQTNDVCGDGSFVVRRTSDNALVGSFSGDGGCNGPTHGGFPQAADHPVFGGYDLEPATAYTVSVSVTGTDTDGTRTAGSGIDTATFSVTTAAS